MLEDVGTLGARQGAFSPSPNQSSVPAFLQGSGCPRANQILKLPDRPRLCHGNESAISARLHQMVVRVVEGRKQRQGWVIYDPRTSANESVEAVNAFRHRYDNIAPDCDRPKDFSPRGNGVDQTPLDCSSQGEPAPPTIPDSSRHPLPWRSTDG